MKQDELESFERYIENRGKSAVKKYMLSSEMSREFEWDKFMVSIPKISFPKDWEVQLQPPYMAAIVRFVAYYGGESISVYLDGFNTLGMFGSVTDKVFVPYWEAYEIDGDIFRCAMNDSDKLISAMQAEFKRRRSLKE